MKFKSNRNFRHGSRENELEFKMHEIYEDVPKEIMQYFTIVSEEKKLVEVNEEVVETASFKQRKRKRK